MNTNNNDPAIIGNRAFSVSELLRSGGPAERDLFQLVTDAMPALISYVDSDRRYRFINEEYEKWFGIDRDHTVGRTISEVLGADAQDKVEPHLKRVFAGEEVRFEAHIHYQKAGWKWVEAHYIPDLAEDGSVRGFFGLVVDITAQKELEARSRQQFEELESIYAAAPIGLAVVDRDLRYVRVNEWLAQINGLPAGEHVGKTVREVVPSIADQVESVLRQVLETGEPVRALILESDPVVQTGEPRSWSEFWTPVKNQSGRTVAVSVVVEDVTESRWAEELLNEQNRLLEMIATGSPLELVLKEITAVIGKLEPRTRAAILVADASRSEFVGAYAANIPESYTSPLVGVKIEKVPMGTCCKAVYCGEPVTSADVANDERWTDAWRELCLQHGIAACHSEPIFGEGDRPLGTIVLGFDTPREPDARGLRMAAFGSHVAGIAIERFRAEQALAASEDKYRVLFDSMDEGYCIIEIIFDNDGRAVDYLFLEVNSAFERQAGMSDVVGRRMLEFVPAIESHWLTNYGSVARTGIPIRFANEYKGLNKWFDVFAFRPHNWEGSRIAVLFTDITERKRAEGEIAAAAARDDYRIRLSDTIRGLQDPEEVKRAAARLLGERLQVNRAFYAEVRGNDWMLVRGYESGVEPMQDGAYSAEDFGPWVMETYRRGERLVFSDTQSDPRLSSAEREAHASINVIGAVGVPLVKAGDLVAILGVHTATARDWSEDEIALINETAGRTWDAAERVRSEIALRMAHDTFRLLVENSPFGIYVVDADFKLARVAAGARKIFANVHPLIGRDFAEVLRTVWAEPFATEAIDIFRRTFATGEPYHSPRTIEARGDIEEVESYDWRIERITMPDGRFGVVCHFYDLSERLRYEEKLRSYHEVLEDTVRERTRELASANQELQAENQKRRTVEDERQRLLAQLVAVQEEERRRIAQDLHDELGQQLTALNMKIQAALQLCAADTETAEHLQEARTMMRKIDSDVDSLAWQLRPAILDDDGFLPAVSRYVEDWSQRYETPVNFWADEYFKDKGRLTTETETSLYRITQEALNNIAKYARAEKVEILLKKRGDTAVLMVQDDGTGFDVGAVSNGNSKRLGLIGMRERAGLVRGRFEVESTPGEGTTIYVTVPLAAPASDGAGAITAALS